MPVEVLTFPDKQQWLEARTHDVTSTEVAALFNASPYMTSFELWFAKKNPKVEQITPSKRMLWGLRLEESVAKGIAEDLGLKVERYESYHRDPELRLGASYDYRILDYDGGMEIKCVDLRQASNWILDEGHEEAPAHIELQVQTQLLLSGKSEQIIAALVGGNEPIVIRRKPMPSVQEAIVRKVKEFWATIDANQEPTPDFNRDADAVISLEQAAEPSKVFFGEDNEELLGLAQEYRDASDQAKAGEDRKKIAKAKIFHMIGDHSQALGRGFKISAGIVAECPMNFVRPQYRNIRVTWKKEKKGK